MRYFVTGATGFIGRALTKTLIARGHSVVIVARTPAKAADLQALGALVHQGDITDIASLREPMRGVDGVFHVAGWYKVAETDTSQAVPVNVEGTRNVLTVMRELGIPKGVYTSTLAINSDTRGVVADETYRFNGEHITLYDRTKAEAHHIADEFIRDGLPLVIVQPGLVYGIGDESSIGDLLRDYLRGKLPMLVTETAFSWAHVDDIVEGHILAMEKGRVGESYIIAGETVTLVDALKLAEEITGVKPPALHMPNGIVKLMGGIMGAVEKAVPLPKLFRGEYLRSGSATYIGSNAKARRELGYNPRPLREGLPEVLRWEQSQLKARH